MTSLSNRNQRLDQREVLARQGLRLPPITLKQLRTSGIYCQPTISIEHQHLARKYVLRGVESGGAVAGIGAFSSFVNQAGENLAWLQRIDSVGVNGVHAVVIAPALIRLQMVRVERTYDLLITEHSLSPAGNGSRPQLKSEVLFFGRRGTLEMEVWGKDADYRGLIAPVFYTRSGEIASIPTKLQAAANLMTAAVCCVGCRHCHLVKPGAVAPSSTAALESVTSARQKDGAA